MSLSHQNTKRCSFHSRIGWRLHLCFVVAAGALLCGGALTSCKPTEKNYRSAYDVARQKREREDARRQELQKDMGLDEGVLQEVDGVRRASIGGAEVWATNASFSPADSLATYSVSVATFKMSSNAQAMAADLRAEGWRGSRAAIHDSHHYVIIGSDADSEAALTLMRSFEEKHKEWQYVGQPGIMLIIGGSRY